MPVLEDYLMQNQQPVQPVEYSDEARKRALWQGVLQAGLAMMADQGKVYRTKGEARGSGFASLGKAGQAGLQGYNQALDADLKNKQTREVLNMKMMEAMGALDGDVISTPQLYKNPTSDKNEIWYFSKGGKPKTFVRDAMPKDLKGETSYDPILIRQTIKDLPKMKEEATIQVNSISNIDDALSLIEGGKVTGKGSQLMAWLAPYAEAIGVKTDGLDDAAKFQAMTKLIRGPMRAQIIGPGQVSNYEQQLLNEMGGGGGTAVEAAKKLLQYYRQAAVSKIDTYNQELEGAIQMLPDIGKVHKRINVNNRGTNATSTLAPSKINRKQGNDGRWYVNDGKGWRPE